MLSGLYVFYTLILTRKVFIAPFSDEESKAQGV